MNNCFDCAYHLERYGAGGTLLGIECGKDNMRFVDYDIASVMRCGAWVEIEED